MLAKTRKKHLFYFILFHVDMLGARTALYFQNLEAYPLSSPPSYSSSGAKLAAGETVT